MLAAPLILSLLLKVIVAMAIAMTIPSISQTALSFQMVPMLLQLKVALM